MINSTATRFTQVVTFIDTELVVDYTYMDEITKHPFGGGWVDEPYTQFWIHSVSLRDAGSEESVEISDPYLWAYLEEYILTNHSEAGEEV